MSVPNPIIIDAQVVAQTNVVNAEALGDGAVNAETLTDNRPMPHITIGEVQTLATGEDATATMTGDYVNPVLNLGLPRGEQGIQGEQGVQGETGNPGASAGFGTPTASASSLPAGSSPTVSVSASGQDTEKVFSFSFGIPKGDKGDTGETGAAGQTGATGATGNGISSIAKTGTSGLVDTYTITYTNGNTSTYQVTNGKDAEPFVVELTPISQTRFSTSVPIETIVEKYALCPVLFSLNLDGVQPLVPALTCLTFPVGADDYYYIEAQSDVTQLGLFGIDAGTYRIVIVGQEGTDFADLYFDDKPIKWDRKNAYFTIEDYSDPAHQIGSVMYDTIAVPWGEGYSVSLYGDIVVNGNSKTVFVDITVYDASSYYGIFRDVDGTTYLFVASSGYSQNLNVYIVGTDTTPTASSPNLITSGAVYTGLNGKTNCATGYQDVAVKAAGILYGEVDSTSTSTAFTATIPGVTSYYDGLTILLKNGRVTSASGFTININGLGAKGSYSNMATGNPVTPTAATRDTTIFNINYTMLFVYSSTVVSGGGWIGYRGYNSDTNTISYQVRTNSTSLPTVSRTRYYRLLFTNATNDKWVPANTEYDNSATSKKTVNQTAINPFGRIVYLGNSTNYAANANVTATAVWDQYAHALGYSFNRTGAALTLTSQKPVYVKCTPQTDGSAIMDSAEPIVQALPSTDDGKIYIYLGIAYSATNIELVINHPVYYYKNGAIRLWTGPV